MCDALDVALCPVIGTCGVVLATPQQWVNVRPFSFPHAVLGSKPTSALLYRNGRNNNEGGCRSIHTRIFMASRKTEIRS